MTRYLVRWEQTVSHQIATRLGELRAVGWVDYARDSWGKVITAPTSSDAEGMVQEITLAGEVALNTARVAPFGEACRNGFASAEVTR